MAKFVHFRIVWERCALVFEQIEMYSECASKIATQSATRKWHLAYSLTLAFNFIAESSAIKILANSVLELDGGKTNDSRILYTNFVSCIINYTARKLF